jgi:hypothetical protein
MVVCGQINGSADDSSEYRVKSEEERRNMSVTTVVTPGKVSKAPPKWRRDERYDGILLSPRRVGE